MLEGRPSGPPRGEPLVVESRPGYLAITNFAEPVETLPLMSVARHLNVVVVVTWKTSPGSRGPVASHSVDELVGADPSVV
jgi:hypothetical protein